MTALRPILLNSGINAAFVSVRVEPCESSAFDESLFAVSDVSSHINISDSSVITRKTTQYHVPEERRLQQHRCENLNFFTLHNSLFVLHLHQA